MGKMVRQPEGHRGLVFNVIFAPDGTSLASDGIHGLVCLCSLMPARIGDPIGQHSKPV